MVKDVERIVDVVDVKRLRRRVRVGGEHFEAKGMET